jgi:glutamine synthetase
LCEVLNPDGTPHESNTRAGLEDHPNNWYGFEQEYTFVEDGRPVGFPKMDTLHHKDNTIVELVVDW